MTAATKASSSSTYSTSKPSSDHRTGKPVEGAVLDAWHTAPNGLYEQQDPEQPDMNLRGRFTTGSDGKSTFTA